MKNLRLRQGRLNDSYYMDVYSIIKNQVEASSIELYKPVKVRTDNGILKVKYIIQPYKYPFLVPAVVTPEGKKLLITFLSFGSLLILCNMIKRFEYTITNEIV